MTKAMPFLQKAILLSYDPRRFIGEVMYKLLVIAHAVDLILQ